jgi:hypothetical protein
MKHQVSRRHFTKLAIGAAIVGFNPDARYVLTPRTAGAYLQSVEWTADASERGSGCVVGNAYFRFARPESRLSPSRW